MKKKYLKFLMLSCAALTLFQSCTKDAFNQKSDIRLQTANTVDDYQKLLDGLSPNVFIAYRHIGDYLSDDTYLTDEAYSQAGFSNLTLQSLVQYDKNMFNNISGLTEWDVPYSNILYTNVVLEGIAKLTGSVVQTTDYKQVKGSALFLRSLTFLNLQDIWGQPYKPSTANTDLGIILKTNSDVKEKLIRSSVAATFGQVIQDLKIAVANLSNTTASNAPISKVRPSKAAGYALLARAYLDMQDYKNVRLYSDSALALYSSLLDYNSIDTSTVIPTFNKEVIFEAGEGDQNSNISTNVTFSLNDSLRSTYSDDDLRKSIFFYRSPTDSSYVFKGDYSGTYNFNGIATDEIYLMRAEANARLGNAAEAIADINTLLTKRFKTGKFIAYQTSTSDAALEIVLKERRKELIMRGSRWADLRRLNQDPRFAKTITHIILGKRYTLPPNDSRYTLQIPFYVITNGPSIIQNP